ncbi:uracil-DNA glycosylase family protein [Comamonas sp. NLF-1-9]|uniref:uracil-DNA glycosylase family protein n=1 Tax=Comamonas sp. NLF-1-9 TaxID=2853163 RepID=UPI001C4545E7|nr:uracil-DNA glycosylase family protein [Comamonas sp. NLF-1-9]QXL84843.1 uracil-DNA glycosylase family protein [Comamonas sp. NLF-1-9]
MASQRSLNALLREIRACTVCAPFLPLGPRPVLQAGRGARILLASQAPGIKVHASGIPFDDASGRRLRQWLGISEADFYDPAKVAIVPIGFCYPGRAAHGSGDAPPRPECAPLWRRRLLDQLPQIELTVLIGQYALAWHLPEARRLGVTQAVQQWQRWWPHTLVLPHPSGRNNGWLKHNPWFEAELLPTLRQRVAQLL